MSIIIKDFFQLGSLRLVARFVIGLRGLYIITSLPPSVLGEYTIWLLYVFYFSFFELGILKGLERDLSHYRGSKDQGAFQSTANTGWSSFILLSAMASLCLAVTNFIFIKQWLLAILLAGYLFTDKIYRAYDTNSRILFNYRANGIAELILAVASFVSIYYCLPRYGIYSIFPCFMGSLTLATIYLASACRLIFRWNFQIKKTFEYIKSSFSLAMMFYSIEIFNVISLTIVAFIWDKETFGYYAFAMRIFQLCLALFPFLIREVLRTRMYFHLAETKNKPSSLQNMIFPMSIYGVTTSIFWLATYWWAALVINRFAPEYKASIMAINILIFSLLPLGINKISSDYLCSRVYNKMKFVISCWVAGIFLQIACVVLANGVYPNIFNIVPAIFLTSVIIVYICIVGYAFFVGSTMGKSLYSMTHLLLPSIIALFSVLTIHKIFNESPSQDIMKNAWFSLASIVITAVISISLIWSKKRHKIRLSVI